MKDFIRKVLSLPSRKDEGSVFAAIESRTTYQNINSKLTSLADDTFLTGNSCTEQALRRLLRCPKIFYKTPLDIL